MVDHRHIRKKFPSLKKRVLGALSPFMLLLAMGCSPDEDLKKPTEVGVAFKVDDHASEPQGNSGNASPQVSLDLKEGKIQVEKIRVIGKRKKGKDVDFERDKKIQLPIEDKDLGTQLLFDLPQGSYEKLKLRLTLEGDNEVVKCIGERIQHFNNQASKATPFRLTIEKKRIVECEVDPKKGKDHVELQKGNPRTIRVMVRPGKWFQGMGQGQWNQADVINDGGKDLLPIHQGKNQQMHSKILENIENAFNSKIL